MELKTKWLFVRTTLWSSHQGSLWCTGETSSEWGCRGLSAGCCWQRPASAQINQPPGSKGFDRYSQAPYWFRLLQLLRPYCTINETQMEPTLSPENPKNSISLRTLDGSRDSIWQEWVQMIKQFHVDRNISHHMRLSCRFNVPDWMIQSPCLLHS